MFSLDRCPFSITVLTIYGRDDWTKFTDYRGYEVNDEVIQNIPLLVAGSMRSAANFASILPGVVQIDWSIYDRTALYAAAHGLIDHHNSPAMAAAVTYLDLFQGWSMFSPDAPTTDFNIVVDAVTVDGRHVDPFNEVANPRYPNPGLSLPPAMGPSWLFYGYENHLPSRPAYHQALREWILRYPDRTGRPNDKVASFKVLKVEDDSPPLGERAPKNLRSAVLFSFPP